MIYFLYMLLHLYIYIYVCMYMYMGIFDYQSGNSQGILIRVMGMNPDRDGAIGGLWWL